MKRRNLTPRERRRLYRIISRLYALFNQDRWKIRYAAINQVREVCVMHGLRSVTSGFVDEENRVIWIDYREDVVPAIIHECLHILYPDAEEGQIRGLERFVFENMSRVQVMHLMRFTGHFLV